MERKLKIRPIGMPGYPINSRVDKLLKEEFDIYREKQEPHPEFKKRKLKLHKIADMLDILMTLTLFSSCVI